MRQLQLKKDWREVPKINKKLRFPLLQLSYEWASVYVCVCMWVSVCVCVCVISRKHITLMTGTCSKPRFNYEATASGQAAKLNSASRNAHTHTHNSSSRQSLYPGQHPHWLLTRQQQYTLLSASGRNWPLKSFMHFVCAACSCSNWLPHPQLPHSYSLSSSSRHSLSLSQSVRVLVLGWLS